MKTTITESMKAQTFGIEIECYHITRENAAKAAAEFFGNHSASYTGYRNGYYTWSALDQQGREWKFSRDVSISAACDEEKCEMVSPILTYGDIELLQELVRALRKAGARSNPQHGCGVHIHIGAAGHTPQSLRNLANIMASHESLIAEALKISRARMGHYCKVINPEFINAVNAKKPKTMADFAEVWYTANHATYGRNEHYNDSRYHMLNYHATFTKGTIEFRLFQFDNPTPNGRMGGLHAGAVKAWVQFCMALSQQAKETTKASPKQPQHENPKYAMRVWLIRLGLNGEEFSTLREIFTKNLTGDAAFRNGRRGA